MVPTFGTLCISCDITALYLSIKFNTLQLEMNTIPFGVVEI